MLQYKQIYITSFLLHSLTGCHLRFMKDWVVEEPPYPRENYVHHNATIKMALVDHWVSSLIHPQNGTLALVKPEWVFSLRIHPQNGTVGDTSLCCHTYYITFLYITSVAIHITLHSLILPMLPHILPYIPIYYICCHTYYITFLYITSVAIHITLHSYILQMLKKI